MKASSTITWRLGAHSLAILVLGVGLNGCSSHKENTPPIDQVRDAVGAALPPYLSVAAVETETIPAGPDEAKLNVKVTVTAKENLFVPDRRVPGDPSILLIKPVQTAGGKTTIYGSVRAQHTVDRWTLSAPEFPDGFDGFGHPRSTFGSQCYVSNTPEAATAIKALQEHADDLERQMQAREAKERQARQAATEQKQREAQAARDKLLKATAPGTRYLGTLVNPVISQSQRVRLTFVEQQGTLLRAEIMNPDQPADHRLLSGEVIVSTEQEDSASAGKNYPIQLSVSTGKQEAVKGRWSFYTDNGPLRLRPDERGGLEGEAVVFQQYVVRLQREP